MSKIRWVFRHDILNRVGIAPRGCCTRGPLGTRRTRGPLGTRFNKVCARLFLGVLLLAGCQSDESRKKAQEVSFNVDSVRLRIVASYPGTTADAADADSEIDIDTLEDGEWFPVAENSLAGRDLVGSDFAITRVVDGQTEVLLLRSVNDIDGSHIGGAYSQNIGPTIGPTKDPRIAFDLKSSASMRMYHLTINNLGSRLAIVLDGKVESIPQIQTGIHEAFMVVSDWIDSFKDS